MYTIIIFIIIIIIIIIKIPNRQIIKNRIDTCNMVIYVRTTFILILILLNNDNIYYFEYNLSKQQKEK